MDLSPHFTLEEFTATQHRDVDNRLPQTLMSNAYKTAQMGERIRTALSNAAGTDVSMVLSSGYRCPILNRLVGSSETSDHLKALAMDWTAKTYGTPYKIAMFLKDHVDQLGIGQLIHEFGTWVHCGVSIPANPINRVITIDRYGTRAGIQEIR